MKYVKIVGYKQLNLVIKDSGRCMMNLRNLGIDALHTLEPRESIYLSGRPSIGYASKHWSSTPSHSNQEFLPCKIKCWGWFSVSKSLHRFSVFIFISTFIFCFWSYVYFLHSAPPLSTCHNIASPPSYTVTLLLSHSHTPPYCSIILQQSSAHVTMFTNQPQQYPSQPYHLGIHCHYCN
jgi:hypothetical protein